METIKHAIDFVLHPDLAYLLQTYGVYIYAILFLIIFVETGLVIMPFLPGDSLLFTAGMLTVIEPGLNIYVLIPLLLVAAVTGDTLNYFVGKYFSDRVLQWRFRGKPLVQKKWIDDTHEFFEKHGNKTIVLARFVPIVRTIAPFVSGIGKMTYSTFTVYNIFGAFLWIVSMVMLGHFLGSNAFVKENLEKFVLGIVFLSVLPMLIKFIQVRMKK
ncbi:MAG: VTT domain-containing protein [Chitinophagales bacterium]|nr:VTT domain-containing protein [Chitinophagales bacterium]HMV15704.1 VTT domain-containing protein [Chitinophagales bacterium]HMX60151.1 VTT domain-containing protein [Chitinophagales bacterium]HMY23711.1 VTT domain-containing protein [Chitinophagales bacterium]HMZ34253.1 VTT domain-containing protein [Chitinophagales bacterium]